MTTANLAVADNDTVVQYTSTGESVFTYPFPILATSELKVSVDQAIKTIGADYTVSGVGAAGGGEITFMAATTAGQRITIWLEMPIQRLTGFTSGAAALMPEDLNAEMVRNTRIDQMLRRDLGRSLRLAVDDPASGQSMIVPTRATRADKLLGFDDAGVPIAVNQANRLEATPTPVATISAMKGIATPSDGDAVLVVEDGRGGVFKFNAAAVAAANNVTTFKADDATVGSWERQHIGGVSVKWAGAKGDGVADDTAALALAIASSPRMLVFPPGTYRTTGNVIPANSGIGSVAGIGRPVLQRAGQATTGNQPNLNILVVYDNRTIIRGLEFDGINDTLTIGGGFPAATDYVDLALNSTVGSPDITKSTDNLTIVTDCYFRDAPGSCIAGSGMQSAIITGNKFDGWFDHAVYLSGGDGLGLGMDAIVTSNIFRHGGTVAYGPSNNAVKVRNRARRYVVANNTFELTGTRFFTHDGGDPPNTNYIPTEVIVEGNVGECGIFFSMLYNLPASNDALPLTTLVRGNNVRCSDRGFYLGDSGTAPFVGSLVVEGNSFTNTSGVWVVLFDIRFLHATVPARIEARNNIVHDFAVMQGKYPNTFTLIGNTFRGVSAGWTFSSGAEEGPTGKILRVINNTFWRPAWDGNGAFDINVGGDAIVEFRGNFYQGCTSVFRLRKLPADLVIEGNTLIDSSGFQYTVAVAARGTVGRIFMARNRGYDRVMFEETIATGAPLLESYNIFLIENFNTLATNPIRATGASVTGYGGANKIYGVDNYALSGTNNVAYPGGNKAAALPVVAI